MCCEEEAILWGDESGKDSDTFSVSMNNRYEGSCVVLVDLFEQVIAESVDDRLYGPLPGPARSVHDLAGAPVSRVLFWSS